MSVLAAAVRFAEEDGGVVLVTLAHIEGSTPREAGAAMAVSATRIAGTIGGGAAEHGAVEAARTMLAEGLERREVDVPLGPALDQCCGGRMRIAFVRASDRAALEAGRKTGRFALWDGGPTIVERRDRQIVLYGAGHVGVALARQLADLPFRLTWVDARTDPFPDGVDAAERIATPLPEAEATRAEPGALHVVMTHSHAVDLEIVSAALLDGSFGFLGLIGSRTKRAVFASKLRARGVDDAALDRLVCPIGALQLRDKRPAVIAASTVAQLLLEDARLTVEESAP